MNVEEGYVTRRNPVSDFRLMDSVLSNSIEFFSNILGLFFFWREGGGPFWNPILIMDLIISGHFPNQEMIAFAVQPWGDVNASREAGRRKEATWSISMEYYQTISVQCEKKSSMK